MQRIFTLILLSALVVAPVVAQDTAAVLNPSAAADELFECPRPLPTADDYRSMAARNVILDSQAAALVAPLEDTFLLHSNPGATQILYIDWDGHKKGGYKPWDMDGDPETFSDAERTVIQQTWFSVSEDFLPFNIDVTTEEPPSGWLGQRAVVDGSGRYDYSWAYGGAWADPEGDIAYVYPGDDTWLWIADSITHEVGHTLNLGHDGRGGQEYYTGHGSGETEWCPVMGWGAYSLNTWSNGDYNGATNQQDDLAVITAVTGIDYRIDDHGGGIITATPIALSGTSLELSAEGIISENDDLDYFAFTLSDDSDVLMSINEDAVIGAANLDVLARLHDASGAVLYSSDPIDSISASFDVHLPAGDYYLSIDGVGWGTPMANPPLGYSDYGILGYYSVFAMAGSGGGNPVPGAVDGLTLSHDSVDPTRIDFSWNASCSLYPVDYAIYTGDLGNFNVRSPVTCTTAGSTSYEDHVPAAGSRYFLVVPKSDTLEGSHGHNSAGAERNDPAGSCEPKAVDLSCP